jgi:hypothetical protein
VTRIVVQGTWVLVEAQRAHDAPVPLGSDVEREAKVDLDVGSTRDPFAGATVRI